MTLMSRPTHDPKLTRWWWRTLREWVYELIDPLWAAFRGENSDEIALANVTGINDVSASELAILDGLTTTKTELNKLSGLTAEASELNKADRTEADGVAEASRNVVLDANKDILGKRYDINQSLLEAMANKPYLWFGGDDYISLGTSHRFYDYKRTDQWGFAFAVRFSEISRLNGILGIDRNDGGNHLSLYFDTNNKLTIRFYGGGSEFTVFQTDALDIISGRAYKFVVEFKDLKATSCIVSVYMNGVFIKSAGAGYVQTFNIDAYGASKVEIGRCYEASVSPAAYYYLMGSLTRVDIFNRTLTVDEVKALSSGAPLDHADAGANQTDLVTNGEDWTGASGSTSPNNWSDSGAGTATYIIRDNTPVENFGDDKALELSTSGGSKTLYQSVAQAGKRYRISFVYRNLDGSSSSYMALGSSTNKVTLQNTGISGDGVLLEEELLADGTDLKFFVDSGGTLQIDHVQVIQIGCVAAYLPDGITHAQWQDASGNELHGSVSGAVPLNLPSNHVARHIKLVITADTTLSNVIPGGYRIKSIVAEVTGAGAGMILNVGTTAGGTDVVNGQDISANGLFDLTVAKHIFSLASAQTLYVNDDGGTSWSGVSVDLYIETERVK